MGITTFPSIVSPIKSIQRGTASTAGNITIAAVNMSRTMVNSFSTASDGTVAASGTISAANGSTGSANVSFSGYAGAMGFNANVLYNAVWTGNYNAPNANYNSPTVVSYIARYSFTSYNAPNLAAYNAPQQVYSNTVPSATGNMTLASQNIAMNSQTISGGSNNLVSAVYGVYLSNSTTLVATGPCRYEVIEYY